MFLPSCVCVLCVIPPFSDDRVSGINNVTMYMRFTIPYKHTHAKRRLTVHALGGLDWFMYSSRSQPTAAEHVENVCQHGSHER